MAMKQSPASRCARCSPGSLPSLQPAPSDFLFPRLTPGFPAHWGSPALQILGQSSPPLEVGTALHGSPALWLMLPGSWLEGLSLQSSAQRTPGCYMKNLPFVGRLHLQLPMNLDHHMKLEFQVGPEPAS